MKENDDLGKDNKKRKKAKIINLISQFPLETWAMSRMVYILYAWVTIFLVSKVPLLIQKKWHNINSNTIKRGGGGEYINPMWFLRKTQNPISIPFFFFRFVKFKTLSLNRNWFHWLENIAIQLTDLIIISILLYTIVYKESKITNSLIWWENLLQLNLPNYDMCTSTSNFLPMWHHPLNWMYNLIMIRYWFYQVF